MQSMPPSVYLYDRRHGRHQLYLGQYSTADGLMLFDPKSEVLVEEIYCDSDKAAPMLSKDSKYRIHEIISWLSIHEHTLVDFTCRIGDLHFSTHDDGECHIKCDRITQIQELVLKTCPSELRSSIMNTLQQNRGKYVRFEGTQSTVYDTFDLYIADGGG